MGSVHAVVWDGSAITTPTFLADLVRATDAYDILKFDGCPCFLVEVPGFRADGSCWRVSDVDEYTHTIDGGPDGRCCVHVKGNTALAAKLKQLLDAMDWYGPWSLMIE